MGRTNRVLPPGYGRPLNFCTLAVAMALPNMQIGRPPDHVNDRRDVTSRHST